MEGETIMNKVRAFNVESKRVKALDRANQLFNTLQRARDTFLSIRNPDDDELVEKHMLKAIAKIEGARLEASSIIRCLRNTGLALLIGLTLSVQDYGVEAEAQTQRRSDHYYYHSNPTPPPFPGSVPGGPWPNLPEPMPAIPPPPVYMPPAEREVIIIQNNTNEIYINNEIYIAPPAGVRVPQQ
jgi:hypothetical protein